MVQNATVADLSIAHRLAEHVLGALADRVRKVILFGSRARGDAGPDSDFDLLVILDAAPPNELRSLRLLLYRELRGMGVRAEPWVMSEEEFQETRSVIGGLAYPAATEGVVLYENA